MSITFVRELSSLANPPTRSNLCIRFVDDWPCWALRSQTVKLGRRSVIHFPLRASLVPVSRPRSAAHRIVLLVFCRAEDDFDLRHLVLVIMTEQAILHLVAELENTN